MVRVRTRDIRKVLKITNFKNIRSLRSGVDEVKESGLYFLLSNRMQEIIDAVVDFDIMFVQGFKHYVKRNRAN